MLKSDVSDSRTKDKVGTRVTRYWVVQNPEFVAAVSVRQTSETVQ
jgi:hypothetical protein